MFNYRERRVVFRLNVKALICDRIHDVSQSYIPKDHSFTQCLPKEDERYRRRRNEGRKTQLTCWIKNNICYVQVQRSS